MSLRGILRGFGLKVGQTTPRTFAGRIRELVEGHPTLEAIAASLLKARDVLAREFAGFERRLRAMARKNEDALRLMSVPGVGVVVSMIFVAAVDVLERFRSYSGAGSPCGITPRQYQSGENDRRGRN